jgi:hypothetical protein
LDYVHNLAWGQTARIIRGHYHRAGGSPDPNNHFSRLLPAEPLTHRKADGSGGS